MSLWRRLWSCIRSGVPDRVSAKNQSLAAGRDLIVVLAEATASSRFRGKIQAFFDEYLVSETGPVPFGGRSEQLARLDDWLHDEQAPNRLLVTAPAGRGKSALFVHWIQSLNERGLTNGGEGGWHLAFIPVSIRTGTNAPVVFYQALATRLADMVGETLPGPSIDADAYYADQASMLLRRLATGFRVLIVFDGVDEALRGRFDPGFFPRDPGPGLKMVVSARLQAGDVDASGWLRHLSWNQGVRASSLEVPALNTEQVAEVLVKMGAPLDLLGARLPVVERLAELTEGEPLLLRLYAEDLWRRRDDVVHIRLEDLDALKPGFGAYFERWLELQRQAWAAEGAIIDDRTINGILAVLACALGPLERDDLARLADQVHGVQSTLSTPQLLRPLRRFIIGSGSADMGYVLSHPKFGQWLRDEYLDAPDVRSTQEGFADWGRETIDGLRNGRLQPEQVPVYLLQFHAEHLLATDAPIEDFMALADQGWSQAWERYEGGYTGFSGDVRTALRKVGAARLGDQNLSQLLERRILCVLCLSSIQSIGRNTPVGLVVLALDEGVISLGQALSLLEMRTENRAYSLSEIAHYLQDDLWNDAIDAVLQIDNAENRAQALVRITSRTRNERRTAIRTLALQNVQPLSDRYHRARLLVELARYLDSDDQSMTIAEALEDAQSVEKPQQKAILLGNLSVLLSDPARKADREAVLRQALEAAAAVDQPLAKASTLVDLAPKLPPDERTNRLEEALKLVEPLFLEVFSTDIPRHDDLAQDVRIERIYREYLTVRVVRAADMEEEAAHQREIDEVIDATQNFRDPYQQVELLVDLAATPDPRSRRRFVATCFAKVGLLRTGNNRTHALSKLAPFASRPLRTDIITEGLRSAKLIEDEWSRATAMIALLAQLEENIREADLQIVVNTLNSIDYVLHRGNAWIELASLLPSRDSQHAFHLGIQLIGMTLDAGFRVSSLVNHFGNLPSKMQMDVLQYVFEDVRTPHAFRGLHLAELAKKGRHLWQMHHLDDALHIAEDTEWALERTEMLCGLASVASQLGREEVVGQALEAALGLKDLKQRVECLVDLISVLPPIRAQEILEQALLDALQIDSALHRCSGLVRIAPLLPGERRQEVLRDARRAADQLSDEQRPTQLRTIAQYLSPDDRIETIRSAFVSSTRITDHQKRVETLAGLIGDLPTPAERLAALDCLIETCSHLPRTSFLWNLSRVAPVVAEFGGARVVQSAIRMISETARWWP